jgi:hypothetical protein
LLAPASNQKNRLVAGFFSPIISGAEQKTKYSWLVNAKPGLKETIPTGKEQKIIYTVS